MGNPETERESVPPERLPLLWKDALPVLGPTYSHQLDTVVPFLVQEKVTVEPPKVEPGLGDEMEGFAAQLKFGITKRSITNRMYLAVPENDFTFFLLQKTQFLIDLLSNGSYCSWCVFLM